MEQILKILKDNSLKCAVILRDEGYLRISVGSSHPIEVHFDAIGENGINIGECTLVEDQFGNLTTDTWGQLQTVFITGSQQIIEIVLSVFEAETETVTYRINFTEVSHQPGDTEETV